MKKYSKLFLALLLAVSISGCKKSDEDVNDGIVSTEPVSEDGYRIAIPFKASDATKVHVSYNRGPYDREAVGKGLQRYATEYFSTSKYYMQEGQLLTNAKLVGNANTSALLGRKSGDNAFGLNPERDSSLPVSDSSSIKVGSETIPIVDVFEYDFISELSDDAQIEGIALAIVVNTEVKDADGNSHKIASAQLDVIGQEAARKLMTYIKDMPEVSNNTPVMVALYAQGTGDTNLAGNFYSVGYGKSSIDSFKSINEKWVIIPSDDASSLDPQIVSQFSSVKSALFKFLPNDIAIIGKGFFVDSQLNELQLTITTEGKTYIQNEGVVQYLKELLSNFSGDGYRIIVKINSNTETFAMLQRAKGTSNVDVIMY